MAADRNRWAVALTEAFEAGLMPAAPCPDAEAIEELYEERAAILEFEAGMTRAEAEALASRWYTHQLDRREGGAF